jgi:hypothetical protein
MWRLLWLAFCPVLVLCLDKSCSLVLIVIFFGTSAFIFVGVPKFFYVAHKAGILVAGDVAEK